MSVQTADSLVAEITELGTIPEVTFRILQMLDDPETTSKDLNHLFKRDQALSSRLLRLANSAFYGFSRQITSVERAIVLLGFNAVKSLAVSASMAPLFLAEGSTGSFTPALLWQHSVGVATGAKMVTCRSRAFAPEEAFLAGIMHDLGILLESQYRAREFAEVIRRYEAGQPIVAAEEEVLGTNHCEVGRSLAVKWQFPDLIIEVLSWHHEPQRAEGPRAGLVQIMYWVDRLACDLDLCFAETVHEPLVVPDLADQLGLKPADLEEIRQALPAEVQALQAILSM